MLRPHYVMTKENINRNKGALLSTMASYIAILKKTFRINRALAGLSICLILFSCNNSFTILDRKYRPGHSFTFSSNKSQVKTNRNFEEYRNDIKTDSITDAKEDEGFSCSNNKEPLIINYKPKPIIFVCDTPPKKNVKEPESLYKQKDPKELKENPSKGKQLEPFNLASLCILILLGFISVYGIWLLIFPLIIFAFNIISLVRIKRNPGKYKKFSKILAIVLLSILCLAILIAGIGTLASL